MATQAAVTIRPLGDHVVIKPANKEAISAVGVILPETAKEKPPMDTIVAVGPGKTQDNGQQVPEVAEVQMVRYAKYAGSAVKIDGEDD